MKQQGLALLLSLALLAGFLTVPVAAAAFVDVPAEAWYAADVADVQQYEIINGVGDGRFDPEGTLTLAQAITMAVRAAIALDAQSDLWNYLPYYDGVSLYDPCDLYDWDADPYGINAWETPDGNDDWDKDAMEDSMDNGSWVYDEDGDYWYFVDGYEPWNAWYWDEFDYSVFDEPPQTTQPQAGLDPNALSLKELLALLGYEFVPQTGEPWYGPYVDFAAAFGLCAPMGSGAYYDGPCSRQTMANLFYWVFPPATEGSVVNRIDKLPDLPYRNETRHTYYLYQEGVLTGSDAYGTFHPDQSVTRAEAAAILNRVMNPAKRKSFQLQALPVQSEAASAPEPATGPFSDYVKYAGRYYPKYGEEDWPLNTINGGFNFERNRLDLDISATTASFTYFSDLTGGGSWISGDLSPEAFLSGTGSVSFVCYEYGVTEIYSGTQHLRNEYYVTLRLGEGTLYYTISLLDTGMIPSGDPGLVSSGTLYRWD